MPRRQWIALVSLLVLSVGGCVTALDLVGTEGPRLYELTPKSTFDGKLLPTTARIDVEVPTATAGLNTARIALKPNSTRLEYYARAMWVDVVPVMVQTLLLESLDNSEKINVLGRTAYGMRADYALLANVREFQAEYADRDQPPKVKIHLQLRLVRLPRRADVASTSVHAQVEAEGTKMQDVVDAFDIAFGRAAKRAVEWTVREVHAADPSS